MRSIYLFWLFDSNHLLQKVQQVADSNRNGKEVFITVFYVTWKLFYIYFSSYIYKNRIWHLWKFFLKIIFPSYIYNYMFCIYSLDFFKKNTDPQLMIFTPSKFLSIRRRASNFGDTFWDWRSSVEFLGGHCWSEC